MSIRDCVTKKARARFKTTVTTALVWQINLSIKKKSQVNLDLRFEFVRVYSFVWSNCMCNSGLSPKGEFNAASSS